MPGFRADSTEQERDGGGNLWRDREWGWGTRWTGVTAITRMAEARHFYDGEQRLRVLQRQDDTWDGANSSSAGVWEEYRYDPLGRRVMSRTRRESGLCTASAATCVSSITRFVWAGDQLLWELKAPGTEYDNLEAATGYNERLGQVSYTHGGGIDRPLALHKEGQGSLIPHDNWRGQFAAGTCVAMDGAGCGAVAWPGWQTNAYHALSAGAPQSENWRGGLVDGMRDATGQMYMRNRYYDPGTGQFTQPDPIGIAGGLNVYGFGAGDPVTYSDPYGLCPWWKPWCKQFGRGGGFGGGGAGGSWDTSQPTRSSASPQAQAAALIVAAEVLEQRATGTASARQSELTFNLGDLSPDEILQIQSLTEHVGRPIWVVGSAARGERNPTSDIDYLTGPSSLPYWQPVQNELPGIDPEHGIVPGTHNPHQGGAIRFEPGEVPKVIPAQ